LISDSKKEVPKKMMKNQVIQIVVKKIKSRDFEERSKERKM